MSLKLDFLLNFSSSAKYSLAANVLSSDDKNKVIVNVIFLHKRKFKITQMIAVSDFDKMRNTSILNVVLLNFKRYIV